MNNLPIVSALVGALWSPPTKSTKTREWQGEPGAARRRAKRKQQRQNKRRGQAQRRARR